MDTITKTLADALRIFDWLERRSIYQDTDMAAVHKRLREAVSDQPVQQARQPLTQASIEELFCDRIDIRADGFLDADDEVYKKGTWFRRGWQAAQVSIRAHRCRRAMLFTCKSLLRR